MTDARIVTVLFTDLVGSTELQTRVGDEQGDSIRRTHFRLLREAVAATGGQEVKNLGDGLMVVFPSAVDALRCAERMQQAVDRHNRRDRGPALWVRIGINAGEPLRDEDDYFGTAVNVAQRLCDAAEGGQIIVAEVVRALAAGRGEFDYEALGPLDLKGIGEPVPTVELLWEPAAEDESSTVPLPSHLTVGDDVIFVGRERELETLREAWKDASSGERRLALVAGEPGVGKTRLMAELAAAVHAEGGIVLGGRSDEEGVLSYQPLVEAIRHYVSSSGMEAAEIALGGMARDLGRLLPELAGVGDGEAGPTEDLETERYRLFQAVAALLEHVTQRAPLLLVLEDLHWADRPTLALLRHLLRVLEEAPLLVCATYRDVELTRRHPLAEWLSSVRRELGYERLVLRGLSAQDITSLLERFAEHDLGAGGQALTEVLLTNTEGNPFFVWEILRHLIASGKIYEDADGRWTSDAASVEELDIPEGVRDAVGRRLSRLSEDADQALREAAVLGRRFTVPVLERLTTLSPDELLTALEEGLAVQLVAEEEGGYEFTHALVRHTLYDELSSARRQRLHAKAAEATEAVGGSVRRVAAHLRRAGLRSDPQKAIEYSLRAAGEAGEVFALEEATEHLAAALEFLEDHDADPAVRARVLTQLGNAVWYMGGSEDARGLECLEEALGLYEELGDELQAARVHSALGLYRLLLPATVDIPKGERHFRAAERVFAGREVRPPLGYVYVGLAGVACWSMRTDDGLDASGRALEIADQLGSESLWANAAIMRGWHLAASGAIWDAMRLFEQAWEIADRIDHIFAAFDAAWIGGFWLKVVGDPQGGVEWKERELTSPRQSQAALHRAILRGRLAADLAEVGRVADARAVFDEEPSSLPVAESGIPVPEEWAGDWETAEVAWEESRRRMVRVGNRQDEYGAYRHLGQVRYWRGDGASALDALEHARALGRSGPNVVFELTACLLVVPVHCELGRVDDAAEALARADELMAGTSDWRGLAGHRLEAQAVLAAAKGRDEDVDRLFTEALEVESRYSLAWREAESYFQWGRALVESGRREASEKLDAAVDVYRTIGAGRAFIERVEAQRPR